MKKYIILLLSFSVLLLFSACGSQQYPDSKVVENLIKNEEFTFMAKNAHPSNYDVINVINSLPTSSSSRMLNLDYGYGIVIKKNELVSTLPYFGRAYTPSMDRDKESLRFTSKNYKVIKTEGRKNSTIFTVIPLDVSHIRRIIMEIYPNGKSYVSIDANDRQPISYDGTIEQNKN